MTGRLHSTLCTLVVVFGVFLVTPCRADTPGSAPLADSPVTVTARVDPQRVTIGTPFRYTLRVEAKDEIELVVPVLAERLGDFSIIDFGEVPTEKSAGRVVVERWYTMVTYETGDQIVPGAPIQYRLPGAELARIDAPDTLIIVDSVLPKGGAADAVAEAKIRDIKGPVAVPPDYRPLWWAAGALALLAGLGYALYRLLNRSRSVATVAARPAHEIALDALTRLHRAHLLDEGRYGEYYVQLSSIVREYLEARFRLRAPEMTTEEFLQATQQNRQLPPDHRAALSQFLGEADLVKFARYVPSVEDAERAFRAARQFVETTAPRVEGDRAAA